jgi:hypothetical protein
MNIDARRLRRYLLRFYHDPIQIQKILYCLSLPT